jgi:replication initiation protein RepC
MPELLHSEPSSPAPIRAAGTRRITLAMRAEIDKADTFAGLPRSTAKPLQILMTFEQALPYLGLPTLTQRLVGFLVRCTEPQDWEEGSRPIAWPSNIRLQELLCVSPQRIKMLIRQLGEAGLFVMRDHPQGKRFGRRDKQDHIIEAYGFDLSRLAQRQDEFKQIAVEAGIERDRMRKLRRRKTQAKRGIAQAIEELGRQGDSSEDLDQLMQEAAELVKEGNACTHSADLAMVVEALESRRATLEDRLRQLIKPVETYPKGQEKLPLNTSTTLVVNQLPDTVVTNKDCSQAEAKALKAEIPQETKRYPERLEITPHGLVELAPRLSPYMPACSDARDWPAIVEAAFWLSSEMGINRTLWARACQVMGREYAAVALALVSTRPAGHFTSGPGGYFAGMLRKFEHGELYLSRTLWKLKSQMWGNEHRRRTERRV